MQTHAWNVCRVLGNIEDRVKNESGTRTKYGYDDASRLTSITQGSNVFSFAYDNANRRTSMTYPNGVVTSYNYDTMSRLTSLGAKLGSTDVTSFAYTYDAAGNRTSKTALDFAESYAYDDLYRLIGVERTGAGAKRWAFGYDAVGNRLFESLDNSSATQATYNERNQLVSQGIGGPVRFRGTLDEPGTATVNGQAAQMLPGNEFQADVTLPSGTATVPLVAQDVSGNSTSKSYQVTVGGTAATYDYDENGSLVERVEGATTTTYEWLGNGKLKRVLSNGSEIARFGYDPLGRRVEKVAGGITTGFTYAGEDILREAVSGGSGAGTFRYVHGPGIDEPLAKQNTSTGSFEYLHADGLGSIVAYTNGSGAVTATRRYDAWGNLEVGDQIPGCAFTGREWDPETGLYYYRARYYDPRPARFVSEDPIRFAGGINFYGYVDAQPTRRVDPSGLSGVLPWSTLAEGWGVAVAEPTPVGEAVMTVVTAYYIAEGIAELIGPLLNDNQDKKLSDWEIKKLKEKGYDPEQLKGGRRTGQLDLYKKPGGEVCVKPKGGRGPGDPTGINIDELTGKGQ